MPETSLSTIFIFSIFIAIAVFFLRPAILTILLLIFIYLLPRAGFLLSLTWYRYPLPIGYILTTFIIIRWIFYLTSVRSKVEKKKPIKKTFYLYILIAIFAIIIGFINEGYLPNMMLETLFYFAAFLTFFMVIDIFERKDCVKIFMIGILSCGFLVSLYGILLLIYGEPLMINYITYNSVTYAALKEQFIFAKRTLSSYGDPNVLSSQLMVFCGIFASLFLEGRYGLLQKIFLLIGLILIVVCIYFTGSRASLIGLFFLLIALAMTKVKKIWLYIPMLVIGYLIFIEPVRIYYEHRLFRVPMQSDPRLIYIKALFEMLVRFPLGVGFGNSLDKNFNIIPAYSIWTGFNSFYLHLLSRVGIQGLIVFVTMLFLILKYLFNGFRYIEDTNVRFFVYGATWGIVAQQLNFITNNIYHVPGGMLNFWIMCGMLVAMVNVYRIK